MMMLMIGRIIGWLCQNKDAFSTVRLAIMFGIVHLRYARRYEPLVTLYKGSLNVWMIQV